MQNNKNVSFLHTQIIKGYTWSQLGKFLIQIFYFLFSLTLARFIGPTKYGWYSLIMSIHALYITITSLGLEQGIHNFIARIKDEDKLLSIIIKFLSIRGVLSLCSCIFIYTFSKDIALYLNNEFLQPYLKISLIYFFFSNILSLILSIYIALLRTKFVALINSLQGAMNLSIGFLLLWLGYELKEIFIILGATSFLSCIISLYPLKRLFKKHKATSLWIDTKKELSFSLTVWINNIIKFLLGKQIDMLLMGFFGVSSMLIGFYNISYALSLAGVLLFTSGLSGVLLASYSKILKEKGITYLGIAWEKTVKFVSFSSIPILIFMGVFSQKTLDFLYGKEYVSAFTLLSMYCFFYSVGIIFGHGANVTILYALNKEKIVFKLWLFTGIINFILDILLIPHLEAKGAVIATGICMVAEFFIGFLIIRRFISIRLPVEFLLKIISASLFSATFTYFFYYLKNIFLLGGIIYMIIFLLILHLLKPISKEEKIILENNFPYLKKVLKFL